MFCVHCGVENPDIGSFCRKCGKALVKDEAEVSTLAGTQVVQSRQVVPPLASPSNNETGEEDTSAGVRDPKQKANAYIALFSVLVLTAAKSPGNAISAAARGEYVSMALNALWVIFVFTGLIRSIRWRVWLAGHTYEQPIGVMIDEAECPWCKTRGAQVQQSDAGVRVRCCGCSREYDM
jgi:hypothetical protein